jgi:surface protein
MSLEDHFGGWESEEAQIGGGGGGGNDEDEDEDELLHVNDALLSKSMEILQKPPQQQLLREFEPHHSVVHDYQMAPPGTFVMDLKKLLKFKTWMMFGKMSMRDHPFFNTAIPFQERFTQESAPLYEYAWMLLFAIAFAPELMQRDDITENNALYFLETVLVSKHTLTMQEWMHLVYIDVYGEGDENSSRFYEEDLFKAVHSIIVPILWPGLRPAISSRSYLAHYYSTWMDPRFRHLEHVRFFVLPFQLKDRLPIFAHSHYGTYGTARDNYIHDVSHYTTIRAKENGYWWKIAAPDREVFIHAIKTQVAFIQETFSTDSPVYAVQQLCILVMFDAIHERIQFNKRTWKEYFETNAMQFACDGNNLQYPYNVLERLYIGKMIHDLQRHCPTMDLEVEKMKVDLTTYPVQLWMLDDHTYKMQLTPLSRRADELVREFCHHVYKNQPDIYLYHCQFDTYKMHYLKKAVENILQTHSDGFDKVASFHWEEESDSRKTKRRRIVAGGAGLLNKEEEQIKKMERIKFTSKEQLLEYVRFRGWDSLRSKRWDVSSITDFGDLFNFTQADSVLEKLDISGWDVSNATTMVNMFAGCETFNQPLNRWKVDKVTDMRCMFSGCKHFNQPLDNWNVDNVTTMYCMFYGCTHFNQPLHPWKVDQVTDMSHMFHGCNHFNQSLNHWNVDKVTDMTGMFSDCVRFYQPLLLNEWNVRADVHTHKMFQGAAWMETLSLPPWVDRDELTESELERYKKRITQSFFTRNGRKQKIEGESNPTHEYIRFPATNVMITRENNQSTSAILVITTHGSSQFHKQHPIDGDDTVLRERTFYNDLFAKVGYFSAGDLYNFNVMSGDGEQDRNIVNYFQKNTHLAALEELDPRYILGKEWPGFLKHMYAFLDLMCEDEEAFGEEQKTLCWRAARTMQFSHGQQIPNKSFSCSMEELRNYNSLYLYVYVNGAQYCMDLGSFEKRDEEGGIETNLSTLLRKIKQLFSFLETIYIADFSCNSIVDDGVDHRSVRRLRRDVWQNFDKSKQIQTSFLQSMKRRPRQTSAVYRRTRSRQTKHKRQKNFL